jgi:hypothetical protein
VRAQSSAPSENALHLDVLPNDERKLLTCHLLGKLYIVNAAKQFTNEDARTCILYMDVSTLKILLRRLRKDQPCGRKSRGEIADPAPSLEV